MANLADYRTHIQELLKLYAGFKPRMRDSVCEYERQVILDPENDHYQLVDVGWDNYNRIHHCVLHLDIKDGKIWVQEDLTDPGIVEKLLERGVPKEDIVLAFHAPYKRPYTGFATA
jgi:hypothetical protein